MFKERRSFILLFSSLILLFPLTKLNLFNLNKFKKNNLTFNLSKFYKTQNPNVNIKEEFINLNFIEFFYDKKKFVNQLKEKIHEDYNNHRVYFYKNTYYSLTELRISFIIQNI